MLVNPRLRIREVVEVKGITHGSVISILNNNLDIKKLSPRWAPRLHVDHNRLLKNMQVIPTVIWNACINIIFRRRKRIGPIKDHIQPSRKCYLQDNARVHTYIVTVAKFTELYYEFLPDPSVSPDLATSGYFTGFQTWRNLQQKKVKLLWWNSCSN